MAVGLGIVIAAVAAFAFAAVAGLVVWGGWQALDQEVRRSFVINPPSTRERRLLWIFVAGSLLGAALLALLATIRILQVALTA